MEIGKQIKCENPDFKPETIYIEGTNLRDYKRNVLRLLEKVLISERFTHYKIKSWKFFDYRGGFRMDLIIEASSKYKKERRRIIVQDKLTKIL